MDSNSPGNICWMMWDFLFLKLKIKRYYSKRLHFTSVNKLTLFLLIHQFLIFTDVFAQQLSVSSNKKAIYMFVILVGTGFSIYM